MDDIPSVKKILRLRKQGIVVRSQDLTSSVILLFSIVTIYFLGSHLQQVLKQFIVDSLTNMNQPVGDEAWVVHYLGGLVFKIVWMLFLLFFVLVGVALSINIAQVGMKVSFQTISPKWRKINLFQINNYKKIFGLQALNRFVFNSLKISAIALVVYGVISLQLPKMIQFMRTSFEEDIFFVSQQAFLMGLLTSLMLILLGLLDLTFQKRRFNSEIKMSRREIEEQDSERDGPKLKNIVINKHSFEHLHEASVVIVDTARVAVGIKYDWKEMKEPCCVAKGLNSMSLKIKDLALSYGIPVVENPHLAQSLFRGIEVGFPIPRDYYHEVAKVLAQEGKGKSWQNLP